MTVYTHVPMPDAACHRLIFGMDNPARVEQESKAMFADMDKNNDQQVLES